MKACLKQENVAPPLKMLLPHSKTGAKIVNLNEKLSQYQDMTVWQFVVMECQEVLIVSTDYC